MKKILMKIFLKKIVIILNHNKIIKIPIYLKLNYLKFPIKKVQVNVRIYQKIFLMNFDNFKFNYNFRIVFI